MKRNWSNTNHALFVGRIRDSWLMLSKVVASRLFHELQFSRYDLEDRARQAATPLAIVPAAWRCKLSRQLWVVAPAEHMHSCQLPLPGTCSRFCCLQDVKRQWNVLFARNCVIAIMQKPKAS